MNLWPRLEPLPLIVEGYELERLAGMQTARGERVTTHIRLLGGGAEGIGEDISPLPEEHDALAVAEPLPLAGEWTLGGFCEHVATVDQWPAPPKWELARRWRNWAFESAALDLALRQAGRPLHDALGLTPQPVRFVNSLGLGEPPDTGTIHRRLARYPGLRFKLDAEPGWTAELIDDLAATRAVDTIDFKGHYGIEVADMGALATLYERVLEAFPDAVLEDTHDLPEIAALLKPHVDRLSYDAPIQSAANLASTPLPSRIVNVKPSRIGGIRPLLEVYAHCQAHGLRMYGGGMGELGVGRGQIQLLASLFHPDAPNDVAPSGFNALEPGDGLPSSPLPPGRRLSGFRWA